MPHIYNINIPADFSISLKKKGREKRLLLFCVLCLFFALSIPVGAQTRKNEVWVNYINKYKDLAVAQMKEHGIPASITLAQGLFESGAGQSELARKSNNHFGIKCHSDWKGKRTYHDDDRKNDCFRVYSSVRDSYEDHSRFLKTRRYRSLFNLNIRDYKGWARGLKACGYATLPTYAERLIQVIELYELYRLDSGKAPQYMSTDDEHQIYMVNHLECVVARQGDTWDSLSRELKARGIRLSARKLRKYNEAPSKDFFPPVGTHIFLRKKARHGDKEKYGKDYWHHVVSGESMYSVSQQYGIRLKNLYKMNFRHPEETLQAGDFLRVR